MVVHRPVLKQKHKPFKSGKGKGVKPKGVTAQSGKDTPLHRRDKKSRIVAKTKSLRSSIQEEAPRLIFVLPFHENANAHHFIEAATKHLGGHTGVQISQSKDGWVTSGPLLIPATILRDGLSRRMILFACPRSLSEILYAASVADVLVCLYRGSSQDEPAFDDFGYKALSVIRQQGVPTPVGIDLEVGLPGDRTSSCNLVRRYFHDELGGDKKFVPIVSPDNLEAALSAIGGVSLSPLTWRSGRGYLMSLGCTYDANAQQLSVVGYARGVGFSVRHPVHVTGLGDFLLHRIELLSDVCPVKGSRGMQTDSVVEEMTEDIAKDLAQEVDCLASVTSTSQNDEDADTLLEEFDKCVRVGGVEEGDVEMASTLDEGDVADDGGLGDVDTYFSSLEDTNPNKKRIEFEQRASEDLSFPDEVDTPIDIPARERFRKYRALRCIKEGAWDPYESLPPEYMQICEFENFRVSGYAYMSHGTQTTMSQSRRTVERNCSETHTTGKYIQLILSNVSPECYAQLCSRLGRPIIVSVVFPFERKVSVLSMNVLRSFEGPDIIASKGDVLLYCGFRRFPAKPSYSQDIAAERGRFGMFCRTLKKGHTATASIYGMALPPNTPVVALDAADPCVMLYGGLVNAADPSRIILKRIVLTGYPFRVHKRLAVVRYMFFQPRDIKYFKPAQLHTGRGLHGVIKEPLGTHGYMKCMFNDTIRQDDIVCLALYKRVYPKWFTNSWTTWLC
ncbi:Pre-rRNA-processing protein TSR1 -like protein [Babesia sp. Xinjiang]|uniref:Pre-rRNA-processing protein TSR1 -like protein n=1 Tax=Babesia sp. Xinjiang TaxID=462227 RepID=UPI000A23913C|nr:Pre-rRNA-processing protein TSR1 -like protein [Babesia sp. Xinjiang]ORM40448.1 Pre-rRNA-processing protein TSR1 -like protein [Babesia sp. Xinjiang]